MKNTKNKTKIQQDKHKTLCTIDTSDILISKDSSNLINKKNNISRIEQPRKNTRSKSATKTSINQITKEKNRHLSNSRYNNKMVQTRVINTETKIKRNQLKSHQRIKTQYEQNSPKKIFLKNLEILPTLKNIKFYMDQQYSVDSLYIVNTLKTTNQESIFTVKYLQKNKLFILKKSNNPKIISKYQNEILIKSSLTDSFHPNQRKNLSCIHKVYKKDKFNHMLLVYYLEGQPLSWVEPLSKKLIQNLHKNNMQILKHLIVEVSKAIHILSTYGYYHSYLRLKNILVELKQDDQNVKVSKLVKVGSLSKCHNINDKKLLQLMPHSIYTPPQILNLIMFQQENKNFNRLWLEYIYKYEQGWRITVYSLGILVLELLNQQPLSHLFVDLFGIIEFQKNIELKCETLFSKINQENFQIILKKMVSINPFDRPSPEQIILNLTS